MLQFPRQMGLHRTLCKSNKQFNTYVKNLNGKSSCYVSLYSFKHMDKFKPWKVDVDSAVIDRAWWDFDSGDKGTIQDVKDDVHTLMSRLYDLGITKNNVYLVATGRGFHVHMIFDKSVSGSIWRSHITRFQNKIAKGLKTLDGVAFPQKMIRVPNTYNVSRKRWAVSIDAQKFFDEKHSYKIPNKPIEKSVSPLDAEPIGNAFCIIKWAHDNPKVEVEVREFTNEIGLIDESLVPIPPCIDKSIRVSNPPHHIRVALVQHMAENLRWFAHPSTVPQDEKKAIEDTICNFISKLGWRDYNPHVTRKGVRTAMDYENSPSCNWLASRGLCKKKCWRYDGSL